MKITIGSDRAIATDEDIDTKNFFDTNTEKWFDSRTENSFVETESFFDTKTKNSFVETELKMEALSTLVEEETTPVNSSTASVVKRRKSDRRSISRRSLHAFTDDMKRLDGFSKQLGIRYQPETLTKVFDLAAWAIAYSEQLGVEPNPKALNELLVNGEVGESPPVVSEESEGTLPEKEVLVGSGEEKSRLSESIGEEKSKLDRLSENGSQEASVELLTVRAVTAESAIGLVTSVEAMNQRDVLSELSLAVASLTQRLLQQQDEIDRLKQVGVAVQVASGEISITSSPADHTGKPKSSLVSKNVGLASDEVGSKKDESMKAVSKEEKVSVKRSSAAAEAKVNQAIDDIMTYNSASERSREDKWAISQSVLKKLTKAYQGVIQRVVLQRKAEISRHHSEQGLAESHNHAKGRRGDDIRNDLGWD